MHTQNLANSRHKYLFVFWTTNANNVYLMFFSAKLDFFYFYFTVCLHGSFSTGIEATPWHPKGLFCHNDIILTVTKVEGDDDDLDLQQGDDNAETKGFIWEIRVENFLDIIWQFPRLTVSHNHSCWCL